MRAAVAFRAGGKALLAALRWLAARADSVPAAWIAATLAEG